MTEALVIAPASANGLVVEQIADFTFVESRKLGFKLQWDGYSYLTLEVFFFISVDIDVLKMYVCVYACMCVCAWVYVCACVVYACVYMRMWILYIQYMCLFRYFFAGASFLISYCLFFKPAMENKRMNLSFLAMTL